MPVSIEAVDVKAKRVLVRADLNIPMTGREITDTMRIKRFAPTLVNLTQRGASVVVLTHLGRPEGKPDPALSTRPIANALAEILGRDVRFIPDLPGKIGQLSSAETRARLPKTGSGFLEKNTQKQKVKAWKPFNETQTCSGDQQYENHSVSVLENIRFYPEETKNDLDFSRCLSEIGDIYVNDAFSCSHRTHASICGVTQFIPSYAGPSFLAEIRTLTRVLEKPEGPVAALVGGAKISTKIGVLRNLLDRMNYLIIGGAMANTFLAAQGKSIGRSLYEADCLESAKDILGLAERARCNIILPVDVVIARELASHIDHATVSTNAIPNDQMVIDVGPDTCAKITDVLTKCKTLLWNGPLGAFETEPFNTATFAVARAAADMTTAKKLITIAGGGDTAAALNGAGVSERFTYLSTAGGAFLEWLEGKELPGVQALKNNQKKN